MTDMAVTEGCPMICRVIVGLAIVGGLSTVPVQAAAQSLGIGPRFSVVRGDLLTNTPSSRIVGGTLRMVTGSHTVLEAAMDYRSYLNEAGTERVRERPVQGSLLLFLVRSGFSPYVGGGIGLYSQTHDTLGANGLVTASTTEKKVGWHLGAGAEIRLARHAALFADYRFRFVKFGAAEPGSEPISIPGSSFIPALNNVKLSHQGSMWTSGVAFYF
jgi:hypothetical protein